MYLRDRILRVAMFVMAVVILKTTLAVVVGYRDYFPPNFSADFLLGRASYFFGAYQWAFYAHIVAGPVTLVVGLLLVGNWFRERFPRWHRRLGRMQVLLILLVVVPSGLWMARYAMSGPVAGAGFAALSLATASTAAMGWQTAVRRRFNDHRRWMLRCYTLLCSAVVLRLFGGLAEVTGAVSTYPLAAWLSWLLPLVVLEAIHHAGQFGLFRRTEIVTPAD